jgi:hypothetical protein
MPHIGMDAMRHDPELYRRALEAMTMDDAEWGEIEPLVPQQTGKKKVDWRFILDVLALRFAFAAGRGFAWTKIEAVAKPSTIRMALCRLLDDGFFDRLASALPSMQHARVTIWQHVIHGTQVARSAQRRRHK